MAGGCRCLQVLRFCVSQTPRVLHFGLGDLFAENCALHSLVFCVAWDLRSEFYLSNLKEML